MEIFRITEAKTDQVPVLLSVPHCGLEFPDDLKEKFNSDLSQTPDDTDWFVDHLYDFAADLGITMISARLSRWVIDLNRDPKGKPLYSDGRLITALCPTNTFIGQPIYKDQRSEVATDEINSRLENYFWPYHHKISALLDQMKNQFGKVLLWDCHSIRQSVPTIHGKKFPDLILGDADGTSASPGLIEIALKNLESSSYSVSRNYLFKGGYITRHFGKPVENQHALQLEMSKVNYMDDEELRYDESRAAKMRIVLKRTLEKLLEWLC